MITAQNNLKKGQPEDFIRLQDLYVLCLAKWYWFVVSLAVTLGLAVFYLLITPPVYTRSASLLIKQDSKGQSLSGEIGSSFSDMGLFQANTNVNNELISLQSPAVMLEVVKRLGLHVEYRVDGRFYRPVLYGADLPVAVSFADSPDNGPVSLKVCLPGDGTVVLSEFTKGGNVLPEGEKVLRGRLSESITTPVGELTVWPVSGRQAHPGSFVYVSRSGLYATAAAYTARLRARLSDEKSTVVELSFQDVSIRRAEDVLSTLISVYNDNWVNDKNQVAVSTSRFINDRLGVIEAELGNVDKDISSYKSENLLPDVQAASSLYMARSSETSTRLLSLNTQRSIARYLLGYLSDTTGKNQLLPTNSGLENVNIENQISGYNTTQLQRNSLVANSGEHNPLVVDLDQSLRSMRAAILSSVDNWVVNLDAQIRDLEKSERQTVARIAASPTQAKYLLSVERQQKVKESLYLFLLQKREENELSQAFSAYNTRVVTPPTGRMSPTAPVRGSILLVALAIGLLFPLIVIYLRENMNTVIRGRKDIESLTLPFVGEIPLASRKRKQFLTRTKGEKDKKAEILVKDKSRNIINEAFRVVRTNLEFMSGKDGSPKVIMVSSVNPGSGKSFISMNLSTCFAIKGKKVIAIDLDLRKASMASLSAYVDTPKKGISDYLSGRVDSYESVIVKGQSGLCPDVIPVGTIPPNPTELLFSERLKALLDRLRTDYDYIFVDCPPAEIVADAAIINKLSDQTLFIVRAGLLDRSMLPEIERFYTERKYVNMSLILNGTEDVHGRYGYHRYGYSYGYGVYRQVDD